MMSMTPWIRCSVLVVAWALAACKGERRAADSTSAATASPQTAAESSAPMKGMPGMPEMPGMQGGQMGGMMSDSMMTQMQSHMQMMSTMSADSMKAMLPMHRQMVANMLSQFNSEMKSMNMPADQAWTATIDSVRQDLVHMPEMSAPELKRLMPAHAARMMRLMEMHRSMMAKMKM